MRKKTAQDANFNQDLYQYFIVGPEIYVPLYGDSGNASDGV